MKILTRLFSIALVGTALLGTTAAHAQTRTIWVQSNGTDTPTCGLTRSLSCRSISAGITRANPGDLVLVGPGLYGDIDYDLQYVSPGDEAANFALGCLVCIDKRVTVASTDGADVTVIDPGRPQPGQSLPPEITRTVIISASGVRFGAPGQGFTVYGLRFSAVQVANVGDVRVIGNVANGASSSPFDLRGRNGPIYVGQNTSLKGSSDGIRVGLSNSQGTVVDNFAVGSVLTGISVGVIDGGADPPIISGNKALRNGIGFSFLATVGPNTPHRISNNVASANGTGFHIHTSGLILQRNTAVGNDSGFYLSGSPNNPDNFFHTNNMIGNYRCGLRNGSGNHVDATNNFWGSSAGPGPKPSDVVCNEDFVLNFPNAPPPFPSTTVVVPFATKAF